MRKRDRQNEEREKKYYKAPLIKGLAKKIKVTTKVKYHKIQQIP